LRVRSIPQVFPGGNTLVQIAIGHVLKIARSIEGQASPQLIDDAMDTRFGHREDAGGGNG
jgi:hypothetical protein